MIGVQPFQNRPECPLLRSPQAEPLGRGFIATRLAILDENGERGVAQRQPIACVHYVGRAMSGTVGRPDKGVTARANIFGRDGPEQTPEDFGGIDATRPGQDRGVAWHVNKHIVIQHNVSFEQAPAAGGVIVQVKDDVRLPSANEPVDGRRLAGEQELVVPVQINSVCVAAGPGRAAVRIHFRNRSQLNGWKPRGHLVRGHSKQGLERPSRRPLVPMLPGQDQDFQRCARAPAPNANDGPLLFGVADDDHLSRFRRRARWRRPKFRPSWRLEAHRNRFPRTVQPMNLRRLSGGITGQAGRALNHRFRFRATSA